ncbi:MAG: DUF1080 domain-containing protein [Verrucomicrobiota bacterium]
MKAILSLTTALTFLLVPAHADWIEMFDGKSLDGWKVSTENPGSFRIEEEAIVTDGPRAHLFYGKDGTADFKDFEFECEVMTAKGANAGIFFHTRYQEEGWPNYGYEAQVNATHKDVRKTGSVYAFKDVNEVHHKDGEWFTYRVRVEGSKVTVSLNGKVINEYLEPEDHADKTRRLSTGTIALQAHDPDSIVRFRKLRIRKL